MWVLELIAAKDFPRIRSDSRGLTCCAGLVLMQLAVPKLRTQSALKAFNKALQACKCDLGSWRERERLAPAQTALLDADNGAGWDLAQALLRPRKLGVHLCSQSKS